MVVAHAQGPGHHLLVPNQYMGGGPSVKGFKGCSLAIGRKEVYFRIPAKASFEEMIFWDDISPKRDKYGLGPLDACHMSRFKELLTLIHWEGGKAVRGRETKQ